jgi:hypothetical protein
MLTVSPGTDLPDISKQSPYTGAPLRCDLTRAPRVTFSFSVPLMRNRNQKVVWLRPGAGGRGWCGMASLAATGDGYVGRGHDGAGSMWGFLSWWANAILAFSTSKQTEADLIERPETY